MMSVVSFPQSSPALVSTIIPAYNARRFIERALLSALSQNVPRAEVLVIDDGSTDGTREIVKTYEPRGVRLICREERGGAAAARNTGLQAATGEYIAFLDADDEWLPAKINRQLAILNAHPQMTFVSCRATLIDENGVDTGDIYRGAAPASGIEGWRTLLAHPCVATPSVLARRSAIIAAGAFNKWLPVAEDQDLWIRLSLMGEIGYIPETLVRVHSTPNSLSKAKIREQADYVLPMVISYLERNRDRLGQHEIRRILGERFSKLGQVAYASGDFTFGLKTIARAVVRGYRPLANMYFVARASVPTRWLKHRLRPARAA
ncbi:MAG: glycosyltransferase [Rhodospirillaceae bacterium]